MTTLNENMQYNGTLNFNLNPTSNVIDISGYQSKKYHEHVNLTHKIKLSKDLFPTEYLDYMPNIIKNSNNKLLCHAKHCSNKSTLKKSSITKEMLQKPGMLKQMKKSYDLVAYIYSR